MSDVLSLLFLLVVVFFFVRLFGRHVLGMGGRRGMGGGSFAGGGFAVVVELLSLGLRLAVVVVEWFVRGVVVPLSRGASRLLERSSARGAARATQRAAQPPPERRPQRRPYDPSLHD